MDEYVHEDIADDMKQLGAKTIDEISDYDFKIFSTKSSAEKWLAKYVKTSERLKDKRICRSKDLICILYKRRYMIQTLMGEKNQTYRDSKRVQSMMAEVRPGSLFNLYDQTFFLTVRLIKAVKAGRGVMCYKFRLP